MTYRPGKYRVTYPIIRENKVRLKLIKIIIPHQIKINSSVEFNPFICYCIQIELLIYKHTTI